MNTKAKALTVILKPLVLLLSISNVYAHELWNMKEGTAWVLGNSTQCTVIEYNYPIDFASEIPEPAEISSQKFKWPQKTEAQKEACEKLKAAAKSVKSWRVAVNKAYPTRPVKNIQTWEVVKGVRANVGDDCGKEVKPYNSRYSYREILINNRIYAVICE